MLPVESIELVVALEEVDDASGLMWATGVEGIEERSEPNGDVRLIAGVPPEHTDGVIAALAPRWEVTRGVMETEKWLDAWRPFARAVRLSERIVVQPPWVEPIAAPGDLVISLEPGRAWGHGAHPTTVLVARELVDTTTAVGSAVAGASVLDLGCGSGLLAVLAAVLGASSVVAIDIDPEAVRATADNAVANEVAELITASDTPVEGLTTTFDLVVANIGIRVLTESAGAIAAVVEPGGLLVLSGLLDEQVDPVVRAYPGFEEVRRVSLEGWSATVLSAPG